MVPRHILHFLLLITIDDLAKAFLVPQNDNPVSCATHQIPLFAEPPSEFGELTNTLARLDRQWNIQQRSRSADSRWRKLDLSEDNEDNNEEDYVYLLEPPNKSIPSCLLVFTGGAGLGMYPHIAYNEFLTRLSNTLNAAVLTAPYQVGLDHFELAKTTGDRTRRAIVQCEDTLGYSEQIPVYALSHSLGSKLLCIYLAATQQAVAGVGLIAFNNFSFSRTLTMVKDYAEKIGTENTSLQPSVIQETLQSVFQFAEMAVNAVGFEFSPSPTDMERLVNQKYPFASITRMFSFNDDNLDDTGSFTESVQEDVVVTQLPGSHLTPVFFKFSVDDLPEEARGVMADASDFQNASFGDEDDLTKLVEEVRNWILGKEKEPLRITASNVRESEP